MNNKENTASNSESSILPKNLVMRRAKEMVRNIVIRPRFSNSNNGRPKNRNKGTKSINFVNNRTGIENVKDRRIVLEFTSVMGIPQKSTRIGRRGTQTVKTGKRMRLLNTTRQSSRREEESQRIFSIHFLPLKKKFTFVNFD